MEEDPFLHLVPEQNRKSYLEAGGSAPSPQAPAPNLQPPEQEEDPFLALVPEKNRQSYLTAVSQQPSQPQEQKKIPTEPSKSKGDQISDYLQYINDSVAKGAKQAIMAPAQFVNPFIDWATGSKLTEGVNKLGKETEKEYQEKHPDAGLIGHTLTNVAEGLPGMFIGGGAVKAATEGTKGLGYVGGLLKGGALGGAAAAPTIYDPSGELSPLQKTGFGAGTGALVAPAFGLAGKTAKMGAGVLGEALDVAKMSLSPDKAAKSGLLGDIARREETLARKEAGHRLGLNLTPAEASGSRLAAQAQGKLGYTKEGARAIEAQQDKRATQEKKSIGDLLDTITKEPSVASGSVRAAAKKAIQDKKEALAEKASPLYDEALYVKNPANAKALADPNKPVSEGKILRNIDQKSMDDLKKDVLISDALKAVGKDRDYKKDLNGVPQHTVKYLDYTKKYLDDRIADAERKGHGNRARLLMDSKNQLVNKIDDLVPAYKEARQTFGPGAESLKNLRDSAIGKISRMKDDKLKNVAHTIFDSKETDPKVMAQLRDEIVSKDPSAWRRIMRNEMENRMATVDANAGSAFYKKILKNDADFKNFMEAAKGMPEVQQKLKDMREVLPYIFNMQSTKAAKGKAETFMDTMRQGYAAALGVAKKHLAKEYDRAAIDLITNGKWDKEFSKVAKIKNPDAKRERIARMFESIIGGSISEISKTTQRNLQED